MDKKRIIVGILSPLAAISASLAAGALIVYLTGEDPVEVFLALFRGIFGTPYGIGQVLFYATPLIFTGLAVSYAFKAGLFNIGCDGQMYMGAILCAWLGWMFRGLPAFFLFPVCFAGAVAGGALWGAIPGLLKARTGAHEVITTIMMNFIALALTNYIVSVHFSVPGTVRTPDIGAGARIARIEQHLPFFKGSCVNYTLLIALVSVFFVWYVLWLSRAGFETRAAGYNKDAAGYAGIDIRKIIVTSMAVSGGLAGMAGINFVMGYKHYFEQGLSGGAGFMGIAVALLARNNPFNVVLSALFFGAMTFGGLLINSIVPKELIEIMQAIVIFFVVIGNTVITKFFIKIHLQKPVQKEYAAGGRTDD
ncbi:MAG: ABC transporter permease [Elusimicrobiota bacterium]